MDLIRGGVITVSDKGYAGIRDDVSGPLLAELLAQCRVSVVSYTIVPDEQDLIRQELLRLTDELGVELVVTTGGTGPAPRDVTPEATLSVIEREMPGVAEVLRFEGYRKTPMAVLSRGVAGIRGQALIINLPGSPKAVREGMEVLVPILPHAIKMLRGIHTEHAVEADRA